MRLQHKPRRGQTKSEFLDKWSKETEGALKGTKTGSQMSKRLRALSEPLRLAPQNRWTKEKSTQNKSSSSATKTSTKSTAKKKNGK